MALDGCQYLRLAAPFVGVPYELHGRTPANWDCWGCVRYLRKQIFGKESPCWGDLYSLEDGLSPSRLAAKMEGLVKERLSLWTPCAAQPGAVVLLKVFDRAAHVGLLLTNNDFIHAQIGCETVISRLDEPTWSKRLLGCFDG